ncbi:MAG: hypothetical protein E7206_04775 [Clostridium beijerinckii]|nr:hypothetical protein [Clostridium beijerinckii]
MNKRLLLEVVASLSLFATATPVFAADMSDEQYATQAGKTTEVTHTDYTTSDSKNTSATQATLVYGFNAINNDPNQIYFANAQGVKQTGWIKVEGTWYYANSDGKVLRSQWLKDSDGKWYYLGVTGKMISGMNVDGYYLDSGSGEWQGNARAGVPNYTNSFVGSVTMSVQDIESKIASGKIKVNVDHGNALGATKAGTGVLTLYLA